MPETDDYIELERLHHGGPLNDLLQILTQAGIPYRQAVTTPTFDITSIGTDTAGAVIVSVQKENYDQARRCLEQAYLELPIPEDHHLISADDDDLMEILSHEPDWSAFDVAHARQMAEERGLDTVRISELNAQRLQLLRQGRQASRILVVAGFLFGIAGACGFPWLSAACLGIAWSLLSMKKKTPEGVFPFYDRRSRSTGRMMLWFALASAATGAATLILR